MKRARAGEGQLSLDDSLCAHHPKHTSICQLHFEKPATAPHAPGSETSKAAADAIIADVARRRQLVFDVISREGEVSAEQIADITGIDKFFIMPRISELKGDENKKLPALIEVVPGKKYKNKKTGKSADIYRVKTSSQSEGAA